MKTSKVLSTTLFHCLIAALILLADSMSGAQLIWDPLNNNGTTSSSGNWDTTAGNTVWYNGSSDVVWNQTSTTAGLNGALFNGPDATAGAYVVTVDSTQVAVTNLAINNNGYAFSGPGSVYVGTSDFLTVAAGKTVTFGCGIQGSGTSPYWLLGSGSTMNVTGNISSGQQVRLAGPANSVFNLSGVNNPAIMYILAPVNVTNGSLIPSSSFYIGYTQTPPAPNNGAAYGTGILTVSGSSTVVTINGNILIIGRSGGSGTLTINDGTMSVGNSTAGRNLAINYDSSANSIGAVNVNGGTLNVGSAGQLGNAIDLFDTAGVGTGATASLNQTAGVINAWGGIVFGSPSGSFAGGAAGFTNSGGTAFVGSRGIVLNTAFPPSVNVALSGGTVGPLANWSSSMPMTLGTLNGNITFQTQDANGSAWNISLSGPLSGPGGMYVTGSGTLALSGSNTYAGGTVVSNGTLAIVTSSTPVTNGVVTVDGSSGSPTLSVRVSNRGQYWTTGALTYTSGTPTADFQYGSLTPSSAIGAVQVVGNVTFAATPNVTVEGTALAAGTYPLIQYTGALSGTTPTTATLPGYASGYITNIAATKTIALVITSSTYSPAATWAIGNGAWDFATANWKQYGSPTNYTDGDAVLFDDTASGTSPITVTLNTTVNPLDVTANNSAKQYTIAGSGSIAGSSALNVVGGGTLTLAGANTYTGGTVVSTGQLNINNGGSAAASSSAIGSGALTLNAGAKIDNTSGSLVTLQPPISENWNGNFTYVGSNSSFNTGAGYVTMNGNITVAASSNNLTVGGQISDNGNNYQLTKTGNGALTLPIGNSFTGGMNLSAGVLNLGDGSAAGQGVFTISGGSIDNVSGSPMNLAVASDVWQGSFTFIGTANLNFGTTTVTVPPGQPNITVNVVSNVMENDYNIVSGNTQVIKTGNGTWTLAGPSTSVNTLGLAINAGQVNFARVAGQSIGPGSIGLTINTGGSATDMNNFQIHSDSPTTPVPVTLSGGVWDLNGYVENVDKLFISNGGILRNGASSSVSTIDLLSGYTATLTGTNCQFDVAQGSTLNFQGPISGAGSLVKTGPGVLNLQSNNTYAGSTVIANGTLALIGAGSISNMASINLLATNSALDLTLATDTNGNPTETLTLLNGQTLSGFGVVTGLVTTVNGATVAPGSAATIGRLTITGDSGANTLNGVTMMKVNKSTLSNDRLIVSGSLVYGGTLALTNLSGSLAAGDSITLFTAGGGYSGAFANIVPSRPGAPGFGLAWNTNNLTVNGTLSVVTSSVPTPPKITTVSVSGGSLSISGSNGVANEPFVLLESGNLATPLSGWIPVLTNAFDGSGNFNVSVPVSGAPGEFFTVFMQ